MRYQDIVIGELLEFRNPSSRYGYLEAVAIILANQDHSTDWKFIKQEKVPYITVICEHRAFSRTDCVMRLRRIRPRDLMKERI